MRTARRLFFTRTALHLENALTRPVGNLDVRTIAASLGGAILNLSYIGHGAEQPDSRHHQHDKKTSITAFSTLRLP
jgi:hypothetical protein